MIYVFLLLVAKSHGGVTSVFVLDSVDMNKHGRQQRDVDIIERWSSDHGEQIWFDCSRRPLDVPGPQHLKDPGHICGSHLGLGASPTIS